MPNTDFKVVIPARYASQRLPGKPLADIAGKPMIQRVYECAQKSSASEVIVATDDQRILDVVQSFGGHACMTSADHVSGTDRLQEVVAKMQYSDSDIVVNLQGDEPLMPAKVIDQVAKNLAANEAADAATLSEVISSRELLFDENVVKVVSNSQHMALYFSRAPIPWKRGREFLTEVNYSSLPLTDLAHRHIGIYAYRVKLLNDFIAWEEAPLEQLEKLEQLRILYNSRQMHIEQACEQVPPGVDTQEDLEWVNRQLAV